MMSKVYYRVKDVAMSNPSMYTINRAVTCQTPITHRCASKPRKAANAYLDKNLVAGPLVKATVSPQLGVELPIDSGYTQLPSTPICTYTNNDM